MESNRRMIFILSISTLISFQVKAIRQYDYCKQENPPPFGELSCSNTHTSSLLECISLAVQSASVSVYFNNYEQMCRWNCIFLASGSCTTYCTAPWSYYAIKRTVNAAIGRPTTSSSVYYNEDHKWGTQFATDGLIPFQPLHTFSSHFEERPWLMVTLNGTPKITFVRIFNRRDSLGERFHDVAIEVSQLELSNFVQMGFFKGPGLSDAVMEFLFDYPTVGQYLRIRITQGTDNILHIAEIEIYAV